MPGPVQAEVLEQLVVVFTLLTGIIIRVSP